MTHTITLTNVNLAVAKEVLGYDDYTNYEMYDNIVNMLNIGSVYGEDSRRARSDAVRLRDKFAVCKETWNVMQPKVVDEIVGKIVRLLECNGITVAGATSNVIMVPGIINREQYQYLADYVKLKWKVTIEYTNV